MLKKILTILVAGVLIVSCKTTSPNEKDEAPNTDNFSPDFISRYEELKSQIADLKEKAIQTEADLFYPNLFSKAQTHEDNMDEAFKKQEEETMLKEANESIRILKDIIKTTLDNKDKIAYLREAIESELAKGEDSETFLANPELFNFINEEYFKGTNLYSQKDMEGALEAFSTAFYASQKVRRNAQELENLEALKVSIVEQLKELERVEALTIADNDGNIVKPKEWNGYDYLSDDIDNLEVINNQKESILNEQATPPSTVEDLLERARHAWELALLFSEEGELDIAIEQLIISRQYSNTYAEYAVLDIHSVKKGDTLWGISKNYYKDPFLWPLIWIKNQSLIKDPDLIYPEWRVVVPAISE